MRLLVVEDYLPLLESLARGLRAEGYLVDPTVDGEGAWERLQGVTYHAVVLDRMLPNLDGVDLVRRMRANDDHTPVLLLTARDGVADRVEGLDAGADDYVSKPFAVAELLARVRRLVRRFQVPAGGILTAGYVRIDQSAKTVRAGERVVPLSPREFQLLEFLIRHRGSVVTRKALWEHLYDVGTDDASNALDVLVARVRRKLHQPGRPELIQTRRGFGYLVPAGE